MSFLKRVKEFFVGGQRLGKTQALEAMQADKATSSFLPTLRGEVHYRRYYRAYSPTRKYASKKSRMRVHALHQANRRQNLKAAEHRLRTGPTISTGSIAKVAAVSLLIPLLSLANEPVDCSIAWFDKSQDLKQAIIDGGEFTTLNEADHCYYLEVNLKLVFDSSLVHRSSVVCPGFDDNGIGFDLSVAGVDWDNVESVYLWRGQAMEELPPVNPDDLFLACSPTIIAEQ